MTKTELLEAIKTDAKLLTNDITHCVGRMHVLIEYNEDSVYLENLQNMQVAMENLRIAGEQMWIGVTRLREPPHVPENPAA